MPPTFGGAPDCPTCGKKVYFAEKTMGPGGKAFHKLCLKCVECNKILEPRLLVDHDGQAYCKACHGRQFGTKGYGAGGALVGEYSPRFPSPTRPTPASTPTSRAVPASSSIDERQSVPINDDDDDFPPTNVPLSTRRPLPVPPTSGPSNFAPPAPTVFSPYSPSSLASTTATPPTISRSSSTLSNGVSTIASRSGGADLCRRCKTQVYFAEQAIAVGGKWHKRCLRCAACSTTLNSHLLEKDGEPFCKRCYQERYGTASLGISSRSPEMHLDRRKKRSLTTTTLSALALSGASASAALLSPPSLDSLLRPRALFGSLGPRDSTYSAGGSSNSTPTGNAGGSSAQVVVPAAHQGRFGHSAVYLAPPTNSLVLIGGQLSSSSQNASSESTTTTQIAGSVLEFRLASEFLWGDDRPVSAIPDNPTTVDALEQGWTPGAFAASAVDQSGLAWIVGGVTADCAAPVVQSLNSTSSTAPSPASPWSTPTFSPRSPPRRRQAQSVPVFNLTTLSTDLWVFGGIADDATCSGMGDGTTVGYVGVDRYDLSNGQVESFAWTEPVNLVDELGTTSANGTAVQGAWAPPVSDYTASVLEDGTSIAVVGGQTAEGDLQAMDTVLVYNVELRTWYVKSISGPTPSSRMGHTTVSLPSGHLLVYGGLSPSHSPLSDLNLLTPPSLTSFSEFSNSTSDPWTWTALAISNHSMTAPSLAWHSSTWVVGGTIVVAFGIDETGEPSNKVWFLTIDELQGTYTWLDTFEGNQEAVASFEAEQAQAGSSSSSSSSSNSTTTLNKRLVVENIKALSKEMVKRVEVIANPKAYSTLSKSQTSSAPSSTATVASAVETAWAQGGTWTGSGSSDAGQGAPESELTATSIRSSSAAAAPSTSASSLPISTTAKENTSSGPDKATAIGASIGAIGGAVALVGLAIILIRRRAARKASEYCSPSTPNMMSSAFHNGSGHGGGGGSGAGEAPLVSTLMYTRPVQQRRMSLGSTISTMPAPSEADTIRPLGEPGQIDESNPFSDRHGVDELGLLGRTRSTRSTGTATTPRGADKSGSVGCKTVASSVRSIPFLSTITRDLHTSSPSVSSPSQDSYTLPAPTLTESRRRSSVLPSSFPLDGAGPLVDVPGTPAELIGLAVTSDDGHESNLSHGRARSSVDDHSSTESIQTNLAAQHHAPTTRAGAEPWETFLSNRPTAPPTPGGPGSSGTMAGVGAAGGAGIPAILRPATPLRVRNADPFADQ
ncbi:hypothetical protein JCM10212_000381 [Sporobolomyces blumeae]